jgi:hypothetical protein
MVPPIAFVVPTSNMLVKKSQHVDVSGRCSHPYLEHWNPPPHNEVCFKLHIFQSKFIVFSFTDILFLFDL